MRTSARLTRGLVLLILVLVVGFMTAGTAAAEPLDQGIDATNRYIIVFDSGTNVESAARKLVDRFGMNVAFSYQHAILGVAVEMPSQIVPLVEQLPYVKYVSKDNVVTVTSQAVPTGIERALALQNPAIDIDGRDDYRVDVDVAVIDTGIDLQHPDLNVYNSTDCTGGWFVGYCSSGGDDDHYHGTHVAGTIGALDNDLGVVGVAPGARLWAVKTLNNQGNGLNSWIIAGIDYVTAHADEIEVANMSLGCSDCSNAAEDEAIANAVAAGVTFVVSAGNDAHDASRNSPANHPDVITVSALADFDGLPGALASPTCRQDQDDTLADFSNFGSTVEIAAPGACIYSTYPIEQGSYGTISGTSMASPHVAGAAALLAASGMINPVQIRQTLISEGSYDWTDESGDGVQEPLLNVSNSAVFNPQMVPGPDPDDDPPQVSITSPTNGAEVSGTVAVTADATDDNGVTQVEFFADGTSLGVDTDGADGWSVQWDTTTSANGAVTLSATVTDTLGQTADASIGVTVNNVITDAPPQVSITAPANGEEVSGVVAVTADATDDNGVAQVEFFADGVSLGVDTDGADGWSVQWDTTTSADGPVILSATATDTTGQTADASVGVTVHNAPADDPPQVAITDPLDGQEVSGTVTVTADAADDIGVTQVEFFVNGGSLGVDTDGADGWTVQWDTTTSANGAVTLSVTATDTTGQTADASIGVTVNNTAPDDPPQVNITAPANGAEVSGTVAVTADATDDNGVTQVEFFAGGTSLGVDTDGADGWSVQWDTTTAADGPVTVSATAMDTIGQTISTSVGVTVSNGTPSNITLSASTSSFWFWTRVTLSWSGANGSSVDITRNGSALATTANDGSYVDRVITGTGSYSYQVCEAGTGNCSNTVSVTP